MAEKVIEDVYVLKPGKLIRDDQGYIRYASSSVVLMIDEFPVIVDTGLREDRECINTSLEELDLTTDSIKAVINTHLHHDHMGCNNMFPAAEKYGPSSCPERISGRIEVIETPGHSHSHIAVIFRGDETVVAAGDAIPTVNNYLERVPPRIHVDRELAMESFRKIESVADIIIPGHDRPLRIKGK